jgi:hypothetical protein
MKKLIHISGLSALAFFLLGFIAISIFHLWDIGPGGLIDDLVRFWLLLSIVFGSIWCFLLACLIIKK